MEERAEIPVLPPHASPTISYWQDPPCKFANLRSTDELPSTADYVIIGSGISGSAIAHNIFNRLANPKVVLLEARAVCSGATGRNGGHTKAASYRSFLDHEQELGVDEAVKIARLEYSNIRATHALARELNLDCASIECETVDIMYSQEQLNLGVKAIKRMQKVMQNETSCYTIRDAEETEKRFLTPNALGSIQYAAGSISAYAFTTGMLKLSLERGLNLQTHTTVTSINQTPGGWTITTDRGSMTALTVVVATNGYTAHILPQMQGLIVPLHGQVIARRPGSSMSQTGFDNTYSFIFDSGYEYMITRPPGVMNEGDIVIGGGIHKLPNAGASRYGNTDDSTLEPVVTQYLRDCTKMAFGKFWGHDTPRSIKKEWSGIMGATADGLPYVGQLPQMQGVFICAGFNGHGMVLCLKAAEALADLMLGARYPEWFPRSMLISEDRLQCSFKGRKDLRAPGESQFSTR